jgi:hypothetical protein
MQRKFEVGARKMQALGNISLLLRMSLPQTLSVVIYQSSFAFDIQDLASSIIFNSGKSFKVLLLVMASSQLAAATPVAQSHIIVLLCILMIIIQLFMGVLSQTVNCTGRTNPAHGMFC